jgi:phenylalanyl-tRNA synthetase beta chain
MILSRKYLKQFLSPSLARMSTDKWIQMLDQLGLSVAKVETVGHPIAKIVIARVEAFEPHPNADRLRLCKVNDGSTTHDVVCGAHNFEAGDIIVFAKEGAVLPGHFEIKPVTIRGQQSNGMICSKSELSNEPTSASKEALKSLGIWNLSQAGLSSFLQKKLGQSFSRVLDLEDTLIEIEVTPNRGDCLSYLGVARELMAKQGLRPSKNKQMASLWYEPKIRPVRLSALSHRPKLTASNTPVFLLQFWDTPWDSSWETPLEVARLLDRHEIPLIHPLVDLGNFIMLESGQPIHVYDLDKVEGELVVRMSKRSEKGVTLSGDAIKATGQDVVIADEKKLLCVGGIIGMKTAAIDSKTKRFAIEAAHFEPDRIRRTCQALMIQTDSSSRFERGVDPSMPQRALHRYASLLRTHYDLNEIPKTINLGKTSSRYRQVISTSPEEILSLAPGPRPLKARNSLEQLGCVVKAKGKTWQVSPPAHRFDLNDPCDLSEEVARHYGYDRIASNMHLRVNVSKSTQGQVLAQWRRRNALSDRLVSLGYLENVHVNFLSKSEWASKLKYWVNNTAWVSLENPIHQEKSCMAPMLFPHLIEQFLKMVDRSFLMNQIFEIGRTFEQSTKKGVLEETHLALLCSYSGAPDFSLDHHPALSPRPQQQGWAVLKFKATVVAALEELGVSLDRIHFTTVRNQNSQLLHPFVHQEIWCESQKIGFFAELHPDYEVLKKRKHLSCIFGEINLDFTKKIAVSTKAPIIPSIYPGVARDASMRLPQDMSFGGVLQEANRLKPEKCQSIQLIDTYTESSGVQSLTLRLNYEDVTQTLNDKDVNKWQEKFRVSLKHKTNIEYK